MAIYISIVSNLRITKSRRGKSNTRQIVHTCIYIHLHVNFPNISNIFYCFQIPRLFKNWTFECSFYQLILCMQKSCNNKIIVNTEKFFKQKIAFFFNIFHTACLSPNVSIYRFFFLFKFNPHYNFFVFPGITGNMVSFEILSASCIFGYTRIRKLLFS